MDTSYTFYKPSIVNLRVKNKLNVQILVRIKTNTWKLTILSMEKEPMYLSATGHKAKGAYCQILYVIALKL